MCCSEYVRHCLVTKNLEYANILKYFLCRTSYLFFRLKYVAYFPFSILLIYKKICPVLEIFLQNYRKVILCTSATISVDVIKPVQTEYCRMEFALSWKCLKQRKR